MRGGTKRSPDRAGAVLPDRLAPRPEAPPVDETKPRKILIIGAVEVRPRGGGRWPRPKGAKYLNTRAGRIRLAAVSDNSAGSIQAFARANVAPGTTLISDGHRSYLGLEEYRHDPRVVGKMAGHISLPRIHRVFSLMKL